MRRIHLPVLLEEVCIRINSLPCDDSLNCQYALCGLIVGHEISEIPEIGVALTLSITISAPAIAGIHTVMSPLGKDYDYDINTSSDEESQ
ncbi:hypothetical protein L1887_23454 [Cichorium endivia]|nr:hypothetical protein L1887_23454 [Cichorium endivia]